MSSSASADSACVEAEDVALAALLEDVPQELVGPRVDVVAEADRVVTHLFECLDPGYVGWRWAVTVARASRAKNVTVNAVTLLPGPGSLLAPDWVPWQERIEAGDLRDGDVIVTAPDDPRLVPGFSGEGEPAAIDPEVAAEQDQLQPLWWELGLGKVRVLSDEGRLDAADRWLDGSRGPGTRMARSAPGECFDCGFFVPLSGALGQSFGVCANRLSPADGEVVAVDFGCGAHSEASVTPVEMPPLVLDEMTPDREDVDLRSADEADDDLEVQAVDGTEVSDQASESSDQASDQTNDSVENQLSETSDETSDSDEPAPDAAPEEETPS